MEEIALKHKAFLGEASDRKEVASYALTPPELLYYLAKDAQKNVRLQVAQNANTPLQADLILAEDIEPEVRMALTKKMVQKLAEKIPEEKSRDLLHAVFLRLSRDPDPQVRYRLASHLKSLLSFSKEILMQLAQDEDIATSQQVVQYSPALDEKDLLVILTKRKEEAISHAVASRLVVSELLSEVIVDRNQEEPIATLLENKGAKISERTLTKLSQEAHQHPKWHEALSLRPSLPFEAIKRLALVLSGTLLKNILNRSSLQEKEKEEVIGLMKTRLKEGKMDQDIVEALQEDYTMTYSGPSLKEAAHKDHARGLLGEERLLEFLFKGQVDYVTEALSLLAQVLPLSVEKALNHQNARALVALSWRAGLSPRFSVDLQQRAAKLPPQKTLYPRQGSLFPLSEEEMRWTLEFFEGL